MEEIHVHKENEKINDTLIAHLFLFIVYLIYHSILFIDMKLLPQVIHLYIK